MYDNFDSPDENDEKAIEEALSKYKEMESGKVSHFFDSEEFEIIIDYFIAENSLIKAEKIINDALTQYPSQMVPFLLRKAICYASSNQELKALDILTEIETIEPGNADILLTKGAIYSQLQRYEKAIEEFKKALKDYDELDEVYYSIAQEYQNLGQTDKAIAYLIKSLVANPNNEAAIFELSMVFELSSKSEDAVTFFSKFSDENPMMHLSWFCLAMAYANVCLYEKAIQAFDYCIVLEENFLSAYLNKCNALMELEQYQKAIDTYHETMTIDPDNSYILYCIGECYLDMDDLENAEKFFLDSIKFSELFAEAWVGLASVYEEQCFFDRSINCMEKALDLDEDNVDFLQYIAKLYHISDNSEKAIIFYKKALVLLPDSTDTWLDLAELYYADFENFNLAIATLNEANVAIGHVDNEIITRISAYLFLNGQIDEAELFLLSIQDTDFDYIGKILLYDSTLINNQPFWEMAERLKN
ncbi:MAG: hypothetical protein WCP69_08430 [Bacteroidota bacterium]